MFTPAYCNLPADAGGVAPHVLVGAALVLVVAGVALALVVAVAALAGRHCE